MAEVVSLADRKIPRELAESDFQRFADAMDLDVDKSRMDEEDRKAFEESKSIIFRAMERGQLVIDEKGQPVYTTTAGETLTFYEPTGGNFMAMDAHKKGHDVAKLCALMAEMTRQTPKTFAKLPQRDFKICRTIVTLFLG